MPFDNLERARKLRAKAASSVVPAAEARALLQKAEELEAKERKLNPPPTNHTTTVTGDAFWLRGGTPPKYKSAEWNDMADTINDIRRKKAEQVAQDLLKNQWKWNTEYYGKDGVPYSQPDMDDLYEETYKWAKGNDDGFEE